VTRGPTWWVRVRHESRHGTQCRAYSGARAARGAKTPSKAFWVPVLQVLEEAGGRAGASQVEDSVGQLMAVRLNEVDQARVRSGGVRWSVTLRWACHHMKQEGLLAGDAPRGICEISNEGRAYLRRHLSAAITA